MLYSSIAATNPVAARLCSLSRASQQAKDFITTLRQKYGLPTGEKQS